MTLIGNLPANKQGKDYVIGDLHGCYSLLQRLLEAVAFDPRRDRLFSVGDLIDRGLESLLCLQLLAEPWFHAVQGNHEYMMLQFFLPYLQTGKLPQMKDVMGSGFLNYGGDWVNQYYRSFSKTMTSAFNKALAMTLDMPLIYSVGEGNNRFNVIHAELISLDYKVAKPSAWQDSDIDCWFQQQMIPPDVEDRLYWSRTLMSSEFDSDANIEIQPGLSRTFCGHTYSTRPRQVLSHVCLDTGAFVPLLADADEDQDDFSLTLFDVRQSNWVSASYRRFGLVWGEHPKYQ
jgi:Calcineurin-like phosphoesterase